MDYLMIVLCILLVAFAIASIRRVSMDGLGFIILVDAFTDLLLVIGWVLSKCDD